MKNYINTQIRAKEVRLINLPDGHENGIYKFEDALKIASDLNLDLIEISSNTTPPVCKIMEYTKFLYEKKQKEKEIKKNQKNNEIKEMWLSPEIGEHDLETKAKKTSEFLKDGNKVKVALKFKGRAIMFKNRGELAMLKFADMLKEDGIPEAMPKLEGKNMHFILKPLKKS